MFSLLWYETKESIINKDKRLIYIKHDITTTIKIQRVPLYIYVCLIIKFEPRTVCILCYLFSLNIALYYIRYA